MYVYKTFRNIPHLLKFARHPTRMRLCLFTKELAIMNFSSVHSKNVALRNLIMGDIDWCSLILRSNPKKLANLIYRDIKCGLCSPDRTTHYRRVLQELTCIPPMHMHAKARTCMKKVISRRSLERQVTRLGLENDPARCGLTTHCLGPWNRVWSVTRVVCTMSVIWQCDQTRECGELIVFPRLSPPPAIQSLWATMCLSGLEVLDEGALYVVPILMIFVLSRDSFNTCKFLERGNGFEQVSLRAKKIRSVSLARQKTLGGGRVSQRESWEQRVDHPAGPKASNKMGTGIIRWESNKILQKNSLFTVAD